MKTEQEFYRKFDMQVRASHRKLRRIPNMWQHTNAWNYTVSDSAMYQYTATHAIEEVECVEILMPRDRLEHIIGFVQEAEIASETHNLERRLIARYEQDRCVRLDNPTVEKAYQKYVMLLELARK
jgi:hypothetical protein